MKISELKKIAKENDYNILENTFEFTRRFGELGSISNKIIIDDLVQGQIFISNVFCDERDFNMIKAAVEFAETPLGDREEEKKFYLKHNCLVQPFTYEQVFLNYDTNNDEIYVYDNKQTSLIQTKFTLKEIEEIKEKFNTDLADFKEVEVEDEEMYVQK